MLKKIHIPSPNFDDRPSGVQIDMIVLHYTDLPSAEEALARLCDPEIKVSAHFLISKDGTLYQLVDPSHRAWHAGLSSWQGVQDINNCSIGIELDNLGHTFGPEPFPVAQMNTLLDLLDELTQIHAIPPDRIVGHSDVAPLRKKDPGELFPWTLLAEKGFGVMPKPMKNLTKQRDMTPREVQQALSQIGYACPQTGIWDEDSQKVCYAFQQRFTPNELTGYPNDLTCKMLKTVMSKSTSL